MKDQLHALLAAHLASMQIKGELPEGPLPAFVIEPPRNPAHGDLSANVAMVLAKTAKRPPLQLAGAIIEGFSLPSFVQSIEILPPGFINFRLQAAAVLDVLPMRDSGFRLNSCRPTPRARSTSAMVEAPLTGVLWPACSAPAGAKSTLSTM